MDASTSLQTIVSNVSALTSAGETMFTTFSAHWFVWMPLTFVVFRFLFGIFKSLLMYRGRRRRG